MKSSVSNLAIQSALGLSAASALIYEVVATNFLFFYFVESSYSIAAVLSIFLLGLGVGSLLVYKIQSKITNKRALFGAFQLLIAVYAFFIISNLATIVPRVSALGLLVVTFVILFLPTVFLGAVFPLAALIYKQNNAEKEKTGIVYSTDLFGAILGSLLAGFVLVPLYGNKIAVLAGAVINLFSAVVILPKKRRIIPLIFLVFVFPSISLSFAVKLPSQSYEFYSPSPFGEVVVSSGFLYIDGRGQCGFDSGENTFEKTLAGYALDSLNSRDLNVLNIGLGCGLTTEEVLSKVDGEVDVVEINRFVVKADEFFSNVSANDRVNLIIEDGLNYLKETKKKYDAILVDVENPAVAYSSDLYTVEAFKIIQKQLSFRGVFGLLSYGEDDRYLGIIYYSLKEVFPYVYNFPGVFLASNTKLNFEEYAPSIPYAINTVNRKILSQAYVNFGVQVLPL